MEIIVLPYIAISFAIGWAIFSPFSRFDDLGRLTLDRTTTADLLAALLPMCVLMAVARRMISADQSPVWLLILIGTLILWFAISGLIVGLFLLDKMEPKTSLKRMATIGVIIPLGSLLTVAWIAFPFIGFAYSISYAIPATFAIAILTLLLRALSEWVCHNPHIAEL
ncbi:hypothetical protein N9L06_04305 [Mariniblastus sp.]|nr:hypothetical protein [Mariniblastus sp.]